MTQYFVKSPILFIIFNRPDNTAKVFAEIRKAKPAKLYVAADGPRPDSPDDAALSNQSRDIIKQIDWDCTVETLFHNTNLGCGSGPAAAIDWFFSKEAEGIILEDDCVAGDDFFRFCDVMLDKYRFDSRIRHISGNNLQGGKKWGDASYYFSDLTHAWGWASWRRVWDDYDKDLSSYTEADIAENLANVFDEPLIAEAYVEIFNEIKNGERQSCWDYQLALINILHHGLSVMPNVNLISNIGFSEDATHTFDTDSPYANLATAHTDNPIVHPKIFVPVKEADNATLNYDFKVEQRRPPPPVIKKKKWFGSRVKHYLKDKILGNKSA